MHYKNGCTGLYNKVTKFKLKISNTWKFQVYKWQTWQKKKYSKWIFRYIDIFNIWAVLIYVFRGFPAEFIILQAKVLNFKQPKAVDSNKFVYTLFWEKIFLFVQFGTAQTYLFWHFRSINVTWYRYKNFSILKHFYLLHY